MEGSTRVSKSGVATMFGGAAMVAGGIGAIVAAGLASKIPGVKSLNPKSLTVVRLAASSAGSAVATAGAVVFGWSLTHLKKPSDGEGGEGDIRSIAADEDEARAHYIPFGS